MDKTDKSLLAVTIALPIVPIQHLDIEDTYGAVCQACVCALSNSSGSFDVDDFFESVKHVPVCCIALDVVGTSVLVPQ